MEAIREHRFGGDWTTEKLVRVRKYLEAYTTIFHANERARYFTTVYVDAFAGTGYRTQAQSASAIRRLLPELAEADNQEFLEGSARIALRVEPPFHKYFFIEKDPYRAEQLRRLRDEFPNRAERIDIQVADANIYLQQWCARTVWRRHRAVVFLDPYGMQVEWVTIQRISETRAIDLWLLFPLGMAVNRLLTKGHPPPPEWGQALTRLFGTDEWLSRFYPAQRMLTLFGETEQRTRQADFQNIGQFFVERLKTIFARVAENPLPLLNSRNVPLYLLCFASGNPKGSSTAVDIASDILLR